MFWIFSALLHCYFQLNGTLYRARGHSNHTRYKVMCMLPQVSASAGWHCCCSQLSPSLSDDLLHVHEPFCINTYAKIYINRTIHFTKQLPPYRFHTGVGGFYKLKFLTIAKNLRARRLTSHSYISYITQIIIVCRICLCVLPCSTTPNTLYLKRKQIY